MDYIVAYHENQLPTITFKAIGGILEYFVLTSGSIDEVVSLYHTLIGKPYLPPFWSLGMH